MTTSTSASAPTLLLPGQAASPAGPCDLSGMYLMHHAFRRDPTDFTAPVAHTPLDDAATWSALVDRWAKMGHHLHEHHTVEDRVLWPLLEERVRAWPAQRCASTSSISSSKRARSLLVRSRAWRRQSPRYRRRPVRSPVQGHLTASDVCHRRADQERRGAEASEI